MDTTLEQVEPSSIIDGAVEDIDCDVAIVGSGMGGATLAWALRDCGADVVVIEQGGFLPREQANWDARLVHRKGIYKNSAPWLDGAGTPFVPANYHYVGGSTKFYGATAMRLREHDFGDIEHPDGVSPRWPFGYGELEPHYANAEDLYWVHGESGGDPTDPWRSGPYPNPPVIHEPVIAELSDRLGKQGLHPYYLPEMLDLRTGGRCIRCATCDAFPCMVDAKGDADVCAMRPALLASNVRLMTHAQVLRLETDGEGRRVTRASVRHHGRTLSVRAGRFVVAAGAVNTAALLLRSRSDRHPTGLANGSDQVGRNYMTHTTSFFIAIDPRRINDTVFQKTIGINDWYASGPDNRYPLGNVQGLGKLRGQIIKAARRAIPVEVLDLVTRRSVDLFVQTEDVPLPTNRVGVDGNDQVVVDRTPTNLSSHRELVRRLKGHVRRAGYPVVLTEELGVTATAHQCGTARMGDDPRSSVVDPNGRAHGIDNLWLCDASTFPSSAAVNPALTVAALALRLGASGGLTEAR